MTGFKSKPFTWRFEYTAAAKKCTFLELFDTVDVIGRNCNIKFDSRNKLEDTENFKNCEGHFWKKNRRNLQIVVNTPEIIYSIIEGFGVEAPSELRCEKIIGLPSLMNIQNKILLSFLNTWSKSSLGLGSGKSASFNIQLNTEISDIIQTQNQTIIVSRAKRIETKAYIATDALQENIIECSAYQTLKWPPRYRKIVVDLDQQNCVVSTAATALSKAILTKLKLSWKPVTPAVLVFEDTTDSIGRSSFYQNVVVNKWFGTATMP